MKNTHVRNTKSSKSNPIVSLGKSTMDLPEEVVQDMVNMVDLTGLVYAEAPNPVVFVGIPEPYVDQFKRKFIRKGHQPAVSQKKGGNRHYVRISRVLDLYKLCLALDGRTLVHQHAIKTIRGKLEQKYGKAVLRAAIEAQS